MMVRHSLSKLRFSLHLKIRNMSQVFHVCSGKYNSRSQRLPGLPVVLGRPPLKQNSVCITPPPSVPDEMLYYLSVSISQVLNTIFYCLLNHLYTLMKFSFLNFSTVYNYAIKKITQYSG